MDECLNVIHGLFSWSQLQESQSYIRDYLLRHVFRPLCLHLKFFCAWANGGSASASQ